MHGAQHLDVAQRIETEAPGNALGDQVNDGFQRLLRFGAFDKEKIALPGIVRQLRHITGIDAVGIDDNRTGTRLSIDLGQGGCREAPGGNDIPQHAARSHRGQLVDITHQNQACPVRQGFQQVVHEPDVDHGGFIHDNQIGGQRPFRIALKSPFLKTVFQQAMDGGRPMTCGLRHTFGGPSGGGCQMDPGLASQLKGQNRLDNRCLSGSRSAGDDQNIGIQGLGHGLFLPGGQIEPQMRLHPLQGLGAIHRRQSALFVLQSQQVAGHRHLAVVKRGPVDGRPGRYCFGI